MFEGFRLALDGCLYSSAAKKLSVRIDRWRGQRLWHAEIAIEFGGVRNSCQADLC
jgi:hypothetical protein